MRFGAASLYLLCSAVFGLSLAQSHNPLTNPGCSTVASFIDRCKSVTAGLGNAPASSISSAVFSCLCYDSNNNYAPDVWGAAASSCTSCIAAAYTTISTNYGAWVAGFCTNMPSAPATTTSSSTTTITSTSYVNVTTSCTSSSYSVSSSAAVYINSTTATSTLAPVITAKPNITTAGLPTTSSVASVPLTVSKAEGVQLGVGQKGSLLSLFGCLLGAFLVL